MKNLAAALEGGVIEEIRVGFHGENGDENVKGGAGMEVKVDDLETLRGDILAKMTLEV